VTELRQNGDRVSRRERKAALKELLQAHDYDAIRAWARQERNPLGTLQAALFTTDPLECRRVIEATGLAAAVVAETDLDAVRESVRKHFWMMNDESGNVGWYAPETIGEILYRVPALVEEFAPLLPSYFAEEPFERGTFEAVARVAEVQAPIFSKHVSELITALGDERAAIRAFAFLALSRVDPVAGRNNAARLADDTAAVERYVPEKGSLNETTVAAIVHEALSHQS